MEWHISTSIERELVLSDKAPTGVELQGVKGVMFKSLGAHNFFANSDPQERREVIEASRYFSDQNVEYFIYLQSELDGR